MLARTGEMMEDKKKKHEDSSGFEETHKDAKSELKRDEKLSRPAEVEIKAGDGGTYSKWMITLALCASFLGLGMCLSVLGPTLEDLVVNVNKNISNISYIFAGRATGYIGGSLLRGILFDLINPHLLLGFSVLTMAFGMFATPFCKQALILTLVLSSMGVSMGILDTSGNVLILNTWGDKAGPHMQGVHFTFAVGAFASPIIAKLLFGHGTQGALKSYANVTMPRLPFFHVKTTMLTSMWAYVVIGFFLLLISFVFFVLYSQSSSSSSSSPSQWASQTAKQRFSKHHVALISLLSLLFFFYVGAEVAYGSYIFTYAKDYAGMDEPHAAELNSLFWGSFAACQLAVIFFATCLYPGTILLFCLVGTVVSTACLALFNQDQVTIWTCTALYGASVAAIFPTGISWVEQYTTVTGKSAAVLLVGAALGEMVLPVSLGFLMGHIPDKPLLMYMMFGTAVLMLMLFPVMYKLALPEVGALVRKQRIKARRQADDGKERRTLLNSVADDDKEETETEDGDSDANLFSTAKRMTEM